MRRRAFVGLAISTLAALRGGSLPRVASEKSLAATTSSIGPNSFSASGGLCAPLTPIYDMPDFTSRPVRDALPLFTIQKGTADV